MKNRNLKSRRRSKIQLIIGIIFITAFIIYTVSLKFIDVKPVGPNRLIKNIWLRSTVNVSCGLFTVFMVIGRLVCGAYWFTGISGGVIFGIGMLFLYISANGFIDAKNITGGDKP